MSRKKKEKPQYDLNVYTKSGKLRKRKRKQSREYFKQETEDAIIEYLLCDDEDTDKKNEIFTKHIYYSFNKLAENLINTFRFYYMDVEKIEHLQHEVVIFLRDKLNDGLYDQSKGKAYSYFGTIAKRYLITYNDNNYKKIKQEVGLEEVDENKKIYGELIRENDEQDLFNFINSFVKYMDVNMIKHFPVEKDLQIAEAVMDIFKRREENEIFSKKYFYLCVREITGQSTPNITRVIKDIKSIYKKCFNKYYEDGSLDTDDDPYLF